MAAAGTRLERIHSMENPYANREMARNIWDKWQVAERGKRLAARLGRKARQREAHRTAVPVDPVLVDLQSELHARINSGLNGKGTFADRAFIIKHLPIFERPIGDGSVTIVEFP